MGKEKAVEVIVTDGEAYMDMYLLASNKYIYVVMFVGDSRADLSNSDFQTVKNSFKLKDRTTNFRMVFLIIAIAIAVIIVIFRIKEIIKFRIIKLTKIITVTKTIKIMTKIFIKKI